MPHSLPWLSLSVLAPALLAGCAMDFRMADLPPGQTMVLYSNTAGDWPMARPESREVLLVPGNMQISDSAVAAGVIVTNMISIPLTKVLYYPDTTKDPQAMHGIPIPFARERGNLVNPIPTRFLEDLQRSLNASIARDPQLLRQRYRSPVWVAGGRAALVEQKGSSPALYQMNLLLQVYRRAENGASNGTHVVDCSGAKGPPRTMDQWSQGGAYLPVKRTLDEALVACERLVLAQTKALMEPPVSGR